MSNDKQVELVILGFLDQRIAQAQQDLEMYSVMKQEVLELVKQGKTLGTNNKFLKLLKNPIGPEVA